jgi:hypothetical protein
LKKFWKNKFEYQHILNIYNEEVEGKVKNQFIFTAFPYVGADKRTYLNEKIALLFLG